MRWLAFAAVFSLVAMADERAVHVVLEDRAVLEIPYTLCHRFSLLESGGRRIMAESYSSSGRTLFAFSRLRDVYMDRISSERLGDTGLMDLLEEKGVINPEFQSLGDNASLDLPPRSVFRISDPESERHHHLLALETRQDPGGTSFFILLGPQSEFYKMSPAFSDMVTNFEIQNVHYDERITPKIVVGSIVLVLLNLAFVWFCFYRLAHLRPHGLDD